MKNRINPTPDSAMLPSNALQRSATTRVTSNHPKQPSPYQQRKLSSQQSTETKRLSGSGEADRGRSPVGVREEGGSL